MSFALYCVVFTSAISVAPLPLGRIIDDIRDNPALAESRNTLMAKAGEATQKPVVKRAKSLAEVGQNRTWLDGRANALEPEIREQFALAMSDFGASGILADELPLLAAAYRVSNDKAYLGRLLDQVREISAWSPLQRPGWTLYTPGSRLPADGKDGNWLATGRSVRAIANMLDILPQDALPGDLRNALMTLLEGEVAGVVDDWQSKRPWFVRDENPITNQWVLPTEGLVRACLVLGVDKHKEAYELGVTNLIKALDAHGEKGEFEEGIGYASFTVTSLMHTARAMAVQGDTRALDRPFLRNFPLWLVHHFQPCDMVINCFDAGPARGTAAKTADLLALTALCVDSPAARWGLAHVGGAPDTLDGIMSRTLPASADGYEPPLFAQYDRAARVNWRDSWSPEGSGVWVRGGHPTDQHDHYDRGHVNFISKGKPLLIEAGTPFYHHPLMGSQFASGMGHNVLQLGLLEPSSTKAGETLALPGWQQRGVVVPIVTRRLDSRGGDVSLTIQSGYDNLAAWKRDVKWDAMNIEVQDSVTLKPDCSEVVLFRWHLGTNDDAALQGAGKEWDAEWPGAKVGFSASDDISVSQVKLPDNTVNTVSEDYLNDGRHTCIVVMSTRKVSSIEIKTKIRGLSSN